MFLHDARERDFFRPLHLACSLCIDAHVPIFLADDISIVRGSPSGNMDSRTLCNDGLQGLPILNAPIAHRAFRRSSPVQFNS